MYNPSEDLYGCYQESSGVFCQRIVSVSGYVLCSIGNKECGRQCTYDGVCELPTMEACAPEYGNTGKKKCPYNAKVTNTCICDTDENAPVGTYCCPTGHTATSTGCTLINCPDGQILNEEGFCVDI